MATGGGERLLGLDVGSRRIGVAVSDELGLAAHGLETIPARPREKALDLLQGLVSEYNVSAMVVGLPVHMNGTRGAGVEAVEEFARHLRERTALPVHFVDERLTTVQAERTLLEANISRAKRKGLRDRLAAVLILQGFLDGRPHEP